MKKVSDLYLVACQADTFTQQVLEFFKIEGLEDDDEWAHTVATGARLLGETARAAIERHKEGERT